MSTIKNHAAHTREASAVTLRIGRILEDRRALLGLTHAAVAELAGVTERRVRGIKAGKQGCEPHHNLRLTTLIGLASALEMPLVELLAGEPAKEKEP